jgi:chromosome segregation ATPase
MSSSTLTRRDPSTSSGAASGRLLVLEPVAAADLEPVILAPGRYHVGSDEDCDVRVTVPGVAPRHCLIVVGPHRSVVKSLAPLTWLNDGVFREAALRPGDRLVAGPIEWTVGGMASSDETRRNSPVGTDAVKLLCDDASSRIELSQAALDARREWEQHRRVDAPVKEQVPAPTPSSAAINEQRAHLTELAASLVAREHEVIARETDVRCHWEDVQKNWAAVRELDRLVRSERAAVAAERAELLAERQAISAVRRELDEARADLGRRALDLTDRESAQQLRADDVVESHSLLSTRSAELQRRESDFAEREQRLAQAEALVAERERELEQHRAQVDRQNAELAEREQRLSQNESARVEQERGLEQRSADVEQQQAGLAEREGQLTQREQACLEREQELEHHRQEMERQQAELVDFERRRSEHESAHADHAQGLEQRFAELDQWQAAHAERESQWTQREQSFAEREQQLAQQTESQNQREEELARREHETSTWRESLTERDRQLEHREQECSRRDQHQMELDADHAQRLQALAQREEAVKARERQLAEGDAQLASRGDSMSQTDEQLARREQECFRREQLLAQFDADHAERVQEWSRRDEELNSKERQLNDQSRELSQRETQVAQRDDGAASREQGLSAREDQLGRREQDFTAREQDVCRREQDLGRRDEHISHREHELTQLDDQVAQREQELSRRNEEFARREQELAAHAQARAEQEAALAQRADELARREAESQRREQEQAEQQRLLEEQRASLNSITEQAAPADDHADRDAEIATLRRALEDRQRQLDDTAEQLRADRGALQLAQRELESRWGGIEREQAALNNRRSELERELAEFATARDELTQLRSSHEADEAIWDKRRGLLDAREQELESRAAQLDRAAADLAARSHDQPLSPQQTLLLGGPIAELLNRPGNSDWDHVAPAINQAASKDLLDERIALDEMRARIEVERDELASLRAEWDAKVAVDIQRRTEIDEERSLLGLQWDELRSTREEYERELAVFVEQRHELRRQLREFAIAQGAPADLVIVDERSPAELTAPAPSPEPTPSQSPADLELPAEQVEPVVPAAIDDAAAHWGRNEAAPGSEFSSGSSATLDGFSGFGSEVMPQPVAESRANDMCATMEINCAAFVDEFGSERLFNDRSATLPAALETPFGSLDWRPEEKLAGPDFISSTGVYDAGAALAEDRSDETIAWPPAGLLADAEKQESQEQASDGHPKEHDSVLALRARLAEMFGLSGSTVRVHDAPPKIPIRNVIDTVDASKHNLELEREQAFSDAPAAPQPFELFPQSPVPQHDSTPQHVEEIQQHNIPTPPPHGSNTEESIAAYMQQLLARSKAKLEVPDDLLAEAAISDSRSRLSVPMATELSPPPPPPPSKTIAPEDKEAIRANLDSFRELANISARSAVAKHQSTKLQTVVQIKFIVLGIALSLTVLLWIAGWFSAGSYLPYTTAAAIASIVMLADVVRTTLAISRLKSMEAAGEYEAETGVGQRSGVNLTPPTDSAGA